MKATVSTLVSALVLAGTAMVAQADQGAIDYRQAVYSSIGGHMNAMAGIVKREVPHTDDLALHARGIAELAPLTMHLFPEGSGDGKTKAKAAIWEDSETFASRREDFIAAARNLGEQADSDMGTFVGAFKDLADTCKACHDDFKAE
ncbi:MAG: cytochrome c [Gammaproteobacteria bacterium]|nr:cytochrome c [Gammaproteobacteria bacterium]